MRMAFFRVPMNDDGAAARELNHFLATHRIGAVSRRLVENGGSPAWGICVTYVGDEPFDSRPASRKGSIDYRELLPPEEFAVFAKLRALRKQLAIRHGVSPFTIFTNEQLAAMVRQRMVEPSAVTSIKGVGVSRFEKYGEPFLEILRDEIPSLGLLHGQSPGDQGTPP